MMQPCERRWEALCWQLTPNTGLGRRHVCQLWTQQVRRHNWESISPNYRALMEHERKRYTEPCE
jgi:hypothetical protein